MATIECPCCRGAGHVEEPRDLSPMQGVIYDTLRRCPEGIGGRELVQRIYASNGGPEYAMTSIHVTIRNANMRLAKIGQKIVSTGGRGAIYQIKQLIDAK